MPDVQVDDTRLAAVLASVGQHLVVDGAAAADTLPRGSRPAWHRPLLAAAVAVAVIAGAVVAIAPARRAVSGWFRTGRIEVEIDRGADPAGLPAFTDPAERIDPAAAHEILGQAVPPVDHSALGRPLEWWTVPEGGVLVDWPSGETLWITVSTDADIVKKVAGGADVVTELRDLGDGGVAITGEHLLQTPHRRVRADNVVIWTDGDLTWRLDGTSAPEELIALAHQLAADPVRQAS
jgi:hypothetical protein